MDLIGKRKAGQIKEELLLEELPHHVRAQRLAQPSRRNGRDALDQCRQHATTVRDQEGDVGVAEDCPRDQ